MDMDRLLVNRQGTSEEGNMTTEKIINILLPNRTYKIGSDILKVHREINPPDNLHIHNWKQKKSDNNYDNSNILGLNDILVVNSPLHIPEIVATNENLAYFNCKMYKHGDIINFNLDKELPITKMNIGERYVEEYLMGKGGGAYIEYHDTPHFHMPLNNRSDGFLILGRFTKDKCVLSAVRIPYGYAIYTSPYTIHCDAFLTGEYIVAYTIADNYHTVLLKDNDGIPADIIIKKFDFVNV